MESAPRFSQLLSCSACCAVQSDSGSSGSVAVVADDAWFCGSVGTDAALNRPRSFLSSLCSFLLSSHACLSSKPPVISVCSYSSQFVGLILPAFRSRLQTTLKRRLGLPAGLVPMVSSLYSMSLGIRPSFMWLTWRTRAAFSE